MARYSALLALVFAILVMVFADSPDIDAPPVMEAEILLTSSAALPSDMEPAWTRVQLPDDWRKQRPAYGGSAWYRTTIRAQRPSNELWAVYLPRVNMNAAVYVNGQPVGSGGRFEPQVARNWNRPLYFTVPGELLRAGDNVVHVRIKADAWAYGLLGGFYVAPDRLLREAYEHRYFAQIDTARANTVLLTALGIFIGIIAMKRRNDVFYGWFALACFAWAYANVNFFIQDVSWPPRLWEAAAFISLMWVPISLVKFGLRYFGWAPSRPERLLFTIGIADALILMFVPDEYFFLAAAILNSVVLGLTGYFLWVVFTTFLRRRDPEAGALSAVGILLFVLGVHDVAIHLGWWPLESALVLPQGSVALFFVAGTQLVNRFLDALRASERLTRELEQRVEEKHAELEHNYRQLRTLEQEQVVAAERERIMRDMHDGMGAQLVGALALAESADGTARMVDALRGALDDLRLMIDSLDPVDEDLSTVLGMLRARMEPRLAANNLCFRWAVGDIPPIPGLGPQKILQVLRLLQEALCNVMKHAEASVVTVSTGETHDPDGKPRVWIEVADDGVGLPADVREGRGLGNMRRRAATIGADLHIASRWPGTVVRLSLPLGD